MRGVQLNREPAYRICGVSNLTGYLHIQYADVQLNREPAYRICGVSNLTGKLHIKYEVVQLTEYAKCPG